MWLVAIAQVQLIFAAELHWHGYPACSQQRQLAVEAQSSKSRPGPPEQSPCLVCQIVRQGAAQPAATSFVLQPARRVVFHAAPFLTYFLSLPALILPIRAPPERHL